MKYTSVKSKVYNLVTFQNVEQLWHMRVMDNACSETSLNNFNIKKRLHIGQSIQKICKSVTVVSPLQNLESVLMLITEISTSPWLGATCLTGKLLRCNCNGDTVCMLTFQLTQYALQYKEPAFEQAGYLYTVCFGVCRHRFSCHMTATCSNDAVLFVPCPTRMMD